jgi:hypothetical protein
MAIKKTLWTYGCSWTQGVGLKDNSTFKNNQWEDLNKASAYAWPNVLAKSINYNCVNNGHGGSSNLEIMHSILDTCQDWKAGDLVIVMWSYYERNIFYHRVPNDIEPWTYQCLPMSAKLAESNYKGIKWYNRYLKEDFKSDLYDSRIKSGYHRLNVEYLCNSLNVNCIHTEVEKADITDGVFESGNIKKKFVDPLQHYLEGNNNSSDKNALDGSHPSEKWHASTAMLFKKYMKKVNIISN